MYWRKYGSLTVPPAGPALREEYWRSLRELFTRDVTHADLSRLLEHEVGETFRFLTREVDTSDYPTIRLTVAGSSFPLCAFMMSPTTRPACFASETPSRARVSRWTP